MTNETNQTNETNETNETPAPPRKRRPPLGFLARATVRREVSLDADDIGDLLVCAGVTRDTDAEVVILDGVVHVSWTE